MATYQLWTTTPTGLSTVTAVPLTLGQEFYVTASGLQLTAISIWKSSFATMTGPWQCGVWSVSVNPGTLLTSDTIPDSGVFDSWQTVTLTTPVALTANQSYRVGAVFNDWVYTGGYWATGGAGASDLVVGPLVAPNAANSVGTLQSPFHNNGTILAYPDAQPSPFASNFWVNPTVSGGGAAGAASDSAAASDVAARAVSAFIRSSSETAAAADGATRAALRGRTATDTAAISDSAVRQPQVFVRAASDGAPAGDVATRGALASARPTSDSVPAVDVVARDFGAARAASDTAAAADIGLRNPQGFARAATDTIGGADIASAGKPGAAATDTALASDATARSMAILRALADNATAADVATRPAGAPLPRITAAKPTVFPLVTASAPS